MASLVEGHIEDSSTLEELPWKDPKILICLGKYSKVSLLHYYIYAMIATWVSRDYRKNGDCYGFDDITDIDETLTAYGVPHQSFESFCSAIVRDEDDDPIDDFYNWFLSEEEAFESLWEKMTDEVFHLLFANRNFLLKFNQAVAEFLQSGEVAIPSSLRSENGLLRRQPYVPAWAKHAVYCRDRGRCVLCNKDLSGLLSTDRRTHYDHIVPLNLGGINDPCNLQLLCEECNLKKSGLSAVSDFFYPQWWES